MWQLNNDIIFLGPQTQTRTIFTPFKEIISCHLASHPNHTPQSQAKAEYTLRVPQSPVLYPKRNKQRPTNVKI